MTTDSKPFCGFYGVLPSHEATVSRGLPGAVTDSLAAWLASGGAGAMEAGTSGWRFAASGGLFGSETVIGVIRPSRDAAGRPGAAFVVASLGDRDAAEACACGHWSEGVETLVRTAVGQSLSADHLVEALEEQGQPGPIGGSRPFEVRSIKGGVRVDVEATPTLAVNMLDAARRERSADGAVSLWWRVSGLRPSLYLLDGLPQGDAFASLFSADPA